MSKIKICGMVGARDIDYVNEASADYCGFVFAESRRKILPAEARGMRGRLSSGITPVGVFADAKITEITELYEAKIIDMAQLHGNETADYVIELKKHARVPVIKAIKAASLNFREITSITDVFYAADFFLLDSGGGSGICFDWTVLKDIPVEIAKKTFLAGGIKPENCVSALAVGTFAIDISSGAETDGVKDREKITELVSSAHSYSLTYR